MIIKKIVRQNCYGYETVNIESPLSWPNFKFKNEITSLERCLCMKFEILNKWVNHNLEQNVKKEVIAELNKNRVKLVHCLNL